jgi:MFS family permease
VSPATRHPGSADGYGRAGQGRATQSSYLYLHAGFFTCGFHIAFLVTHLPGEVALCGLPASVSAATLAVIGLFNIAGSLAAGILGSRYRMKHLLAWMYASRVAIIIIYLMAPKTAMTFYVFAAGLGFTWLATVPPTAGLVGKLFGTRYLATLFGLTLLSHQIGGFFGALAGRRHRRPQRRLLVDVVRRHRARVRGRAAETSRSARRSSRRACPGRRLGGLKRTATGAIFRLSK